MGDTDKRCVLQGDGAVTQLVISEVFGPTVQGEGPSTGEPCAFVRTSNCNLDCVWCDTPYTWDWTRFDKDKEQTTVLVEDVYARLQEMGVRRVVFSGGEPLLQQEALGELAERLDGWAIEVETNGTIPPKEPLRSRAQFNVSIKLPHAQTTANPVRPVAVREFADMARSDMLVYFKWVAADPSDVDRIREFAEQWDLPRNSIWVMPLGTTREAIVERSTRLADAIVRNGFHASTRMHVLMWGDKRGH